jgi:hypothetical protein
VKIGLLLVVGLGLWVLDAQGVYIVFLCIGAAILYGVLHDQVTARVCLEYFTVAHPPVFGTDDPTWLGIGWGVFATWWVGLLLGIPLALAARAGSRPRREPASLVRPIAALLLITAGCALASGLAGWGLAGSGVVSLAGPLAEVIPDGRQVPFLAVLWAHGASYFTGAVGGVVVLVRVWRARGRVVSRVLP